VDWEPPQNPGRFTFVRLDIKRRDALTKTITSPLLDMIKPGTPAAQRDPIGIPAALDLPQVSASEVIPVKPVPIRRPDPKMPAEASTPAPPSGISDNIADWI
jgi:hypothetical protein